MTEPNANQQNDNEQQEGSSGSGQPEYGSYNRPEFGAMSNQYPPDYDPYVYGHPDPPENKNGGQSGQSNAASGQNAQNAQNASGQRDPYGNPFAGGNGSGNQSGQYGQGQNNGQNGPYGQGGYGQNGPYQNPYGQNPYGQGYNQNPQNPYQQGQPYGWNNQNNANNQNNNGPRNPDDADLSDPNQNPLYGHWDVYSILAFVFSLFLPVPLLPAIMGAVAIWRTRTFHMKGFGLAVAAVVINVLYTIAVLWLTVNGMSSIDLYSNLMGGTDGTGGTSVDDESIIA